MPNTRTTILRRTPAGRPASVAAVLLAPAFLIALMSFECLAHAAELSPESRVVRVTVYRQGALIERETRVTLPPGSHRVVLRELPSVADPNSVRVGGSGAAGAAIGGVEVRQEFREPATTAEYRALQKEIDELAWQQALLDDRKRSIASLREFLNSIKAAAPQEPSKDLAMHGFAVESWVKAYEFLSTRWNALSEEERGLDLKRKDLTDKTQIAQGKLSQLNSQGGVARFTAAVLVSAPRGGDLALTVSYLAGNASWTPLYDARLEPATDRVTLSWEAQVSQNTGEDWKDAAITLSTTHPSAGIDLPSLPPIRLVPRPPGTTATQFSAEMIDGLSVLGRNSQDVLKLAPGVSDAAVAQAPVTMPEAIAGRREVSVTFELPGRLDVPSDGQPHTQLIATRDLAARVEHRALPAIAPAVYLVARVTLSDDVPLLPGRVQHYVGGDMVGVSWMPDRAPGEEFPLSFGPDDRFKAERRQVRRNVDHKGKDDEIDYRFVTTIENHLGRDAVVELKDRIPVSGDEKIVVTLNDGDTTPGAATDPNEPGILTWKAQIPKGGKKDVALSYRVRMPRDSLVQGLE